MGLELPGGHARVKDAEWPPQPVSAERSWEIGEEVRRWMGSLAETGSRGWSALEGSGENLDSREGSCCVINHIHL